MSADGTHDLDAVREALVNLIAQAPMAAVDALVVELGGGPNNGYSPMTYTQVADALLSSARSLPDAARAEAPTMGSETRHSTSACPEHGDLCGGVACCCADKHPATPTPAEDAVAQARDKVLNTMHEVAICADGSDQGPSSLFIASHVIPNLDALIVAVRAECAAKVRALPTRYEGEWESRPIPASAFRVDVLRILEAQP